MERRKKRKAWNWLAGIALAIMVYFAAAPWFSAWHINRQINQMLGSTTPPTPTWFDRGIGAVLSPYDFVLWRVRPYYEYAEFCYRKVLKVDDALPKWEAMQEFRRK